MIDFGEPHRRHAEQHPINASRHLPLQATAAVAGSTRRQFQSPSGQTLRMARGRAVLAALVMFAVSSCVQSGVSATALRSYLRSVEPIRLGVNRLLEDADPILDAYREHFIDPRQAAAAMDRLERRFASYTVDVNALKPADPTLAGIHAAYAHTYVLEDAYLSALVAALPSGEFSGLPNTQSQQRAAIIEWRTQLEVIAQATGIHLPADLQQAGRGEIAPAVSNVS
jgi:hypothetical protein